MVVACGGRQLLKSRKSVTFSKKFSLGPSNNTFGYSNYSGSCSNSLPGVSGGSLVRLWYDCRRLHFSKETTRSVLAKLSPQEVSTNASPVQDNVIKSEPLLPPQDIVKRDNILVPQLKNISEIISAFDSTVSTVFTGISQLFTGVIINLLRFIRAVFVGNLLALFSTLNGISFLWTIPNLYLPVLVIYVGLLISDASLYLIINWFSDDPDNFLEVLGTLWGVFAGFVWSFLPF